jgi:hypothetical protein
MRRLLLVAALVAAVVVPTVLAADPAPADFKSPAKYCKAVRESKGKDAFAELYGTNKNKKNAFGKCVSQTAKAKTKAKKAEKGEDAMEANAANIECKKERRADAAKFAQDYKNFGQCMKSHKTNGDDSESNDSD